MQPNRDPLKDLVGQYRAAIEPPPEHVEHERARLLARIAAENHANVPTRRVDRGLLVGAVAAGLLLVWGALKLYIDLRVHQVVEASLAVRQASPPAEPQEVVREVESGHTLVTPVASPPPDAQSAVEPVEVTSQPEDAAPETTLAPAPTEPQRRRGALPVDADALLRESALLSRAREAQARADWRRVLELVDEHKRTYPRGALLEERLILEAAAACNTDQRVRGERAVEALRRKFPRSLALDRMREMCERTADE